MSVHASMYISCIPSICHIVHETQACCRHCPSCVGIAPAARWDGNGFGDGRECAQCMHGRVGACAHCIWRIRSQGLTFASGSMFPPCIVPVPQRLPMRLVCMALSHGLAGTPIWAYGKTQSTEPRKPIAYWHGIACNAYNIWFTRMRFGVRDSSRGHAFGDACHRPIMMGCTATHAAPVACLARRHGQPPAVMFSCERHKA